MAKQQAKKPSDQELEYYSRQIVLPAIGYDGQVTLRNASVCIVGMGGLGSAAALQLAAMGVGHLRLVDYDVVELSNLQRQHLYDVESVGYAKVEVGAKRLGALNPYIDIEPLPLFLDADNAQDIIRDMDVVVDGLDRMTPRYALNRACVKLGVPYVFGAAIITFGNVATIIPGETACLECFQRDLDDETLPTCAVLGVHPSIISVVASIEVAEATRIILGKKPRLIDKLLHCDIEHLEFQEVEVFRSEDCAVCGSRPSGRPMTLRQELVTELCAREGKRTFVIIPKRNLTLDMDGLLSLLVTNGFDIKVRADLGISFDSGFNGMASILKSGIMIIETAADEKQAYDLYRSLLVDQLRIPLSSIE